MTLLAATGLAFNVIIPIVAGVLLLGGIAAIVITRLRRKNAADAVEPTEDAPPAE